MHSDAERVPVVKPPRDKLIEWFRTEMKKRIFVLDGAMGTMVQSYKLKVHNLRPLSFSVSSCCLNDNLFCLLSMCYAFGCGHKTKQ